MFERNVSIGYLPQESEPAGDETVIELEVAESDLGKVIGRSGRVARALRNILSAAGSKLDKRYALEIIE